MHDPNICAQCHGQGAGCCRQGPLGAEKMFGLTEGEIEIMSQASGLAPDQFVVRDQASPQFLEFVERIHPIFLSTMPGGRRLRLKVGPQGACSLLGEQGCSLPWEARPLYCRLYPFWFTPQGQLMVLMSETCLAQKGARSWRDVLANLGESEKRLRELFEQLRQLAHQHQARYGGQEVQG